MKRYVIDCRCMTDKAQAHKHLKSVFSFPEHYGENLDALYDCLGEKADCIVCFDSPWALAQLGDYGLRLLEVFRAAARDGHIRLE